MKKILVVEDSEDVRENLVELLVLNDYEVVFASNGFEGYKTAVEEMPDLIIADIMMPVIDGIELLKMIRNNYSLNDIPLIFLTAKASASDMRKSMNLGADDYLIKPFQTQDVLNAVRTRLEKKEKLDARLNKIYQNVSAYIPHELRTPLSSIIGFSDMILDDLNEMPKEEIRQLLLSIKGASYNLHGTIEKFIAYTEAEVLDNSKEQRKDLTNKSSLMAELLIENIIKKKMIKLDSIHPYELNVIEQEVKIFEPHFSLIVEEVIENAIKFSYPKRPIEIRNEINEDSCELFIKNYGHGLKEDEIFKISPFYQPGREKFEFGGNGLGLMTVKRICSFYGVGFSLKSEMDKYAEFAFTFQKV